MFITTTAAAIVFIATLLFSPETKGKVLISELELAQPAE